MSFCIFWFLSLFLPFLLPSLSSPIAPPSVPGSHDQASLGGNFNALASAIPVVMEPAVLADGAWTPSPPTSKPVLFLPQDPSANSFTESASSSSDHGSVSPELGSVVIQPHTTQGPLGTTGTYLTPLIMGYYPVWSADAFPPENIDFSCVDWIDFAFAMPNEAFGLDWDGSDKAPGILMRLVDVAHQHGKKVKLSVGGWGGSRFFSPAVNNSSSRQTFVKNIALVYDQFHLDGIDIDWEYPAQRGDPRNYVGANDTANFFEFLSLLRGTLPRTARISAAVQTTPFADATGQPMKDVRLFANILDWLLIMNYDVWGASSSPGPNAPLSDACRNSTQPTANAEAAIKAWTAAGVPPSKLVLGVPSYGYISTSPATRLRQRDQNASLPNVHALTDGGANEGQVQFCGLVRQGVLRRDPTSPGGYVGGSGFTREWDACSSTPFLRSEATGQIITYDDAQSLELKSAYAKQSGLLGINIFDIHGDTNQWELLASIRRGLGL